MLEPIPLVSGRGSDFGARWRSQPRLDVAPALFALLVPVAPVDACARCQHAIDVAQLVDLEVAAGLRRCTVECQYAGIRHNDNLVTKVLDVGDAMSDADDGHSVVRHAAEQLHHFP